MKASIKNCCTALVLCQLLLGANQVWSSNKKKDSGKEQKAKTAQQELKEIENSLVSLSAQMATFDVDLRARDFRNVVQTIRTELDQKLNKLEKLSVSSEDKKRVKKAISAADEVLNVMIENWRLRQEKLAKERERALDLELTGSPDYVNTGSPK